MIYPHEFTILWEIALDGPLAACEFSSLGWDNYYKRHRKPAGATLSSLRGRGLLYAKTAESPHIWDLTEKGRSIVYGDK